MTLTLYVIVSFINVFLHIARSILVIKSTKFIASAANCICYTFSAIVIKFIAEADLWIAIAVQATTNFLGCYAAMWVCENNNKIKSFLQWIKFKLHECRLSRTLKGF